MQSKRSRVAAAGFIAVGVAIAVNGCSLLEAVDPPISSAIYATGAEGKTSDAAIELPTWVPDDSTTVRVKINRDSGAEILQFTPVKPETIGGACTQAPSANVPQLDDTWWLQTLPTDDGIVCQDNWFVTAVNGMFYAWKNS